MKDFINHIVGRKASDVEKSVEAKRPDETLNRGSRIEGRKASRTTETTNLVAPESPCKKGTTAVNIETAHSADTHNPQDAHNGKSRRKTNKKDKVIPAGSYPADYSNPENFDDGCTKVAKSFKAKLLSDEEKEWFYNQGRKEAIEECEKVIIAKIQEFKWDNNLKCSIDFEESIRLLKAKLAELKEVKTE